MPAQFPFRLHKPICPRFSDCESSHSELWNWHHLSVTVGWDVNGVSQTAASYSDTLLSSDIDTVILRNIQFQQQGNLWYPCIHFRTKRRNRCRCLQWHNSERRVKRSTQRNVYNRWNNSWFREFLRCSNSIEFLWSMWSGCIQYSWWRRHSSGSNWRSSWRKCSEHYSFQSETGDSSAVVLVYPSQPAFYYNKLPHSSEWCRLHYISTNSQCAEVVFSPWSCIGIHQYRYQQHSEQLQSGRSTEQRNQQFVRYRIQLRVLPTNDSMNTFTYNRILNGSLGIYMNGINTVNLEQSLSISHNVFDNQYSKGIQMSNQGVPNVLNNTFTTSTSYLGYSAIYLDRCQRNQLISRIKFPVFPELVFTW